MSKCRNCGVDILDDTDVCPLCRCVIEAQGREACEEHYPDIRLKTRKLDLISRVILFLSIVAGVLVFLLNRYYWTQVRWSAAVIGGLAYLQLFVFYIIKNDRAGYRSKGLIGMGCGTAYAVLLDYVFGFRHWSLDYAAPAALLALDVIIIVLMFVNIRNWQSYLLFQIFMILCSGVCVLLSLAGIIRNPVMSYTALGISCTLFLASFIIGGKRASNELRRRFHVM